MSRIRSIHPKLFTDEAFVSLSMPARVLLLGLWVESDDQGVFEWKPISLKMRIFPVDNVEVQALLGELEAANVIKQFDIDGRSHGAVRNFCKYQRPKSPKFNKLTPANIRIYVASKYGDTEAEEAEREQFPQNGETSAQREEGGDNRKRKKEDKITADAVPTKGKYAFESGTIRLTERDFNRWKTNFTHLDLGAELIGLTKWAGEQGANWFHAVSGALTKRNREAKAAAAQAAKPEPEFKWKSGIEGVY